MIELYDWAIVYSKDPLKNTIKQKICLIGNVFNNPKFKDGTLIKTSYIKLVSGRKITTATGTIYNLIGKPNESYWEYLSAIGYQLNLESPIKINDLKCN